MRGTQFSLSNWRLDPGSPQVLYRQIYERLREAIRSGLLKPHERVPSARVLASQLGAARGTIELAYSLLAAEGYIVGRGAAGTFVASGILAPVARVRPHGVWLSQRSATTTVASPRAAAPLQLGLPSLDAFPKTVWSRLLCRSARSLSREDLTGGDCQGHLPLRNAIASYLALSRGVLCDSGQIVITGGFQGALGLITRAFLSPRSVVCVEEPGYPNARRALEVSGVDVVAIPVDAQGLDVATAVRHTPRAHMICVTPAHQSPTGVSLSLSRRLALLAWAAQSRGWILEDDYDSEFRYDSRPLPALKSLDDAGRVLYCGTFSKVLFPALRLGYLVVPQSEVARVVELNRLLYGPAPRLTQAALCDFMVEGHFSRHIRRMRALYKVRRAALAEAIAEVFQGQLQVRLASGGMHLIVQGKMLEDDRAIEAQARKAGLAPSALSGWYQDQRTRETGLLLGFTNLGVDSAIETMVRLRNVLRR